MLAGVSVPDKRAGDQQIAQAALVAHRAGRHIQAVVVLDPGNQIFQGEVIQVALPFFRHHHVVGKPLDLFFPKSPGRDIVLGCGQDALTGLHVHFHKIHAHISDQKMEALFFEPVSQITPRLA